MDLPGRCSAFVLLTLLPLAYCWSPVITATTATVGSGTNVGQQLHTARAAQRSRNEISPYIDLVLCPIREQPWSCARQQSARILDLWDGEVHMQWQKLKVEADRQLNATIERRGYSASEILTKEKPSTILKKIEIGTIYMRKYLGEAMDGFLGREYNYVKTDAKQNFNTNFIAVDDDDSDDDDDDNGGGEEEETQEDDVDEESEAEDVKGDDEAEEEEEEEEDSTAGNQLHAVLTHNQLSPDSIAASDADASADTNQHDASTAIEFIEIGGSDDENDDDDDNRNEPTTSQLKKPGGGGGGKKKRKGNKPQQQTILVVQPAALEAGGGHVHGGHQQQQAVDWVPVSQGKPSRKQKRKKRRKHQHGDEGVAILVEEEEPSHHLGLLEELADAVDVLDVDEGHQKKRRRRKNKRPHKYGRSVGVMRGKKKKKKKALAKLMLLGAFLKAKIELLLKILGAHLQIKFLAIALIGLLINIARFWIDVKRGGTPQKVVYVEHAHHQHHYDEHADDWGGGETGGGYWKRSLQTTDPNVEEDATVGYKRVPQNADPHFMAYHGQWQQQRQ